MNKWLVSALCFSATFEGNLKHASSTDTIYPPLEEYLGTTAKLGPVVTSEICASMSGFDDRFLTLMSSGADESELEDVVTVFIVFFIVIELLELEDVLEAVTINCIHVSTKNATITAIAFVV